MIQIIDLNYSVNRFPLVSDILIEKIKETLSQKKKVLVFLNRRGESSTYICKDCGYQVRCENCDIAMTIHKYPHPKLICHLCSAEKDYFLSCPKCKSSNMIGVGVGTQKIEDNLAKILPETKIIRLDSDKLKKEGLSFEDVKNSQILIATEVGNMIEFEDLGLVVFVLFESEMTIPEYDIEEKIYDNIAYNSKKGADVIIQTYIPESPLLKIITSGNYKEFLDYSLGERKIFGYPPYKELVYLWVKSPSKERIKDLILKTKNKLDIFNESGEVEIITDINNFSRVGNIYKQKIILKGKNLQEFLQVIKLEIIRNRELEVEWK